MLNNRVKANLEKIKRGTFSQTQETQGDDDVDDDDAEKSIEDADWGAAQNP